MHTLYTCSTTPFANGASDDPKAILKRMGGGQLNLETGNWLSVSSSAKVTNMTLTKDLLTSYFTKKEKE